MRHFVSDDLAAVETTSRLRRGTKKKREICLRSTTRKRKDERERFIVRTECCNVKAHGCTKIKKKIVERDERTL